jgi:GDP-L-fucose synthase
MDLMDRDNCRKAVEGASLVIHMAARVGGIGFNRENPATLFYENLMMGAQLMEEARLAGVRKFVAIGTVCAYPKFTPVPFSEDDFWNGYPEETNAPYGLAKKMLLVQAQAYRQQYGFNAIYLLPVNLYGPGDNFDPRSSHVIPALIRKLHAAKETGAESVEVWGDGSASREFLYVDDAAEAIALASARYDGAEPVNLGAGREITIKELVTLLSRLIGFKGQIVWDTSKPNGQPRRYLDVRRAQAAFGFRAHTDFEEGLRRTVQWWDSVGEPQSAGSTAGARQPGR